MPGVYPHVPGPPSAWLIRRTREIRALRLDKRCPDCDRLIDADGRLDTGRSQQDVDGRDLRDLRCRTCVKVDPIAAARKRQRGWGHR